MFSNVLMRANPPKQIKIIYIYIIYFIEDIEARGTHSIDLSVACLDDIISSTSTIQQTESEHQNTWYSIYGISIFSEAWETYFWKGCSWDAIVAILWFLSAHLTRQFTFWMFHKHRSARVHFPWKEYTFRTIVCFLIRRQCA